MDNQVRFGYGVMVSSLEEQAKEQGYTLGSQADFLEELRHSINMCAFHVATDSQTTAMFKKLNKKVTDSLMEFN